MIFLGAGASKPYGIPTLEEFSKEVITKLKESHHTEILERIRASCKEFNIKLDFETLYSILEGLINPVNSVQHSGPLTAFLVRSKKNLPKGYDYLQILTDLRKLLYEKCSIICNEKSFKKVEEYMEKLLLATKKNHSVESIMGIVGPRDAEIGKIFVTTNYDMALELYFFSKEIPIIDGYAESPGLVKHFDPSILWDIHKGGKHRGIIKLHGSIWQFLRGNEMIKTKLDPKSGSLPFEIQVEREMMIYPTREKDILNYSFRDEPINTAIIENMKINKRSQIIIISPKPNEVLENLYQNIPENINWKIPKNRLFKFSGEFGTPEVFEYLQRIESVSDHQDSDFDPTKFE
jgi:hypothetical protein